MSASILEVRRHAFTKKGAGRGRGSHLDQAGVDAARELGDELGPFARVYTSAVPRALETAVAMGFAVEEQLPVLGDVSDEVFAEIGHHERWSWDEPFVEFRRHVESGGATGRLAEGLRCTWAQILEELPDGARALVISHGRVMECGLVACLPHGPLGAWGRPFSHLEGFRLEYRNGAFTRAEILRNAAGQRQRALYDG